MLVTAGATTDAHITKATARHQHGDKGEMQQAEQETGWLNSLLAHHLSWAILQTWYLLSHSISTVFAKQLLAEPSPQPCQTPPWHKGAIALWWQKKMSLCRDQEGGRRDRSPALDPSLPAPGAKPATGGTGGTRGRKISLCAVLNITSTLLVMLSPIPHTINQSLTYE